MDRETWVAMLGFAGFALALFGYLAAMKRDLRAEIGDGRAETASLRTELKSDIAGLRTELKSDLADLRKDLKADIADVRSDIGRLDGRMTTLEQRTYDLSTRLPARPA